jgi:hypothetical protein
MLGTITMSPVFLPFFFSSFIILVSSLSSAPVDLKIRTRDFALRVIRLYSLLPKSTEAQVIGKQILHSGTSVGANYREGSAPARALSTLPNSTFL